MYIFFQCTHNVIFIVHSRAHQLIQQKFLQTTIREHIRKHLQTNENLFPNKTNKTSDWRVTKSENCRFSKEWTLISRQIRHHKLRPWPIWIWFYVQSPNQRCWKFSYNFCWTKRNSMVIAFWMCWWNDCIRMIIG